MFLCERFTRTLTRIRIRTRTRTRTRTLSPLGLFNHVVPEEQVSSLKAPCQ